MFQPSFTDALCLGFLLQVKAKVAEELERQMVEFKKSLQATANDSLVAPKDDVLDARLEYLEKTVCVSVALHV